MGQITNSKPYCNHFNDTSNSQFCKFLKKRVEKGRKVACIDAFNSLEFEAIEMTEDTTVVRGGFQLEPAHYLV